MHSIIDFVVVHTKIARSDNLGISDYYQTIANVDKLASFHLVNS